MSVTVHVPEVFVHDPDQPINVDPAEEVAVRTTVVPLLNDAEHVAPHVIPDGELEIEPEPVTEVETVNVPPPPPATALNVALIV